MFTRVARGFEELAELGLIERRPIRFVGGQAAGCAPVATAFGRPARTSSSPSASRTRSSDRWRSAIRRTVATRSRSRATSGGSIEAIADETTAAAIRDVARLEGIYPETAGGVTLAPSPRPGGAGVIRDGDEVVALLTGNGLKTPDARTLGRAGRRRRRPARPGQPGLAPVIRPSLTAFEAWLEGAS